MVFFNNKQNGNVFFALFGAVAFIGVLGAATMSFMKGPLKTSVTLSRMSVTNTQMQVAAQMAVLQASTQSDFGDCDSDGFVEPIEFKTQADVNLKPINGGNIPDRLGATKKDPWGRLYGYCVWNSGTNITIDSVGACDNDSSGAEQRIEGSSNNFDTVLAIISSGADRSFQTTCLDFAAADVDGNGLLGDVGDTEMVAKASGSDDIILAYTYAEASINGSGLWSIKSSDPGTAIIEKAIEFSGGLSMGTSTDVTICNPSSANVMRYNPFVGAIETCDGIGTWEAMSGGDTTNFTDENGVVCDNTVLGQVRFNTTTDIPEFCDGTDWRSFTLASNTPNLVFTPSQQNTMDVDGAVNKDPVTCSAPWICGDEVTFTLQNQGGADSASVVTSIDNGTYFVITSDACNGNILTPMASCNITIRPRASGNLSYTDYLRIIADNNPMALIQGQATAFGCSPGVSGGGGTYVACGQNDGDGPYDLVIIPSGCDGSFVNPVCSGTDGVALRKAWGPTGRMEALCQNDDGVCSATEQHINIMEYQAIRGIQFPAANYCNNLDYNGKTDWFLPSKTIMSGVVYPLKSAGTLIGFNDSYYSTSLPHSSYSYGRQVRVRMDSNYVSEGARSESWYVRCVRRDDIALPAFSAVDTNPTNYKFTQSITYSSGAIVASNTITAEEILQTITVSVSGASGSPKILLNGVDAGTSVSGVGWGDTIAIEATAPTALGTRYNFTINVGDDVLSWNLGYADSSIAAKVFVTSSTYNGNLGGLAGADAKCNSLALGSTLGLSGKWKAILSSTGINASGRVPWNWGTIEDVAGTTIVDGGFNDLWDGTLDAGISLDENGTLRISAVQSATNLDGSFYGSRSCTDWTSSTGSSNSRHNGQSGSVGGVWIDSTTTSCSSAARLYCIEDVDDVSDTTPNIFYPKYEVQVPISTRTISDPIAIGGMSVGGATNMSVSATGGTPKFTINGGAEISSGTISNGDSIVFYMTAPATGNSYEKMTITADAMTTYWRVWTGDTTGTAVKRVFVTSSTHNSNFGGVIGADSFCQSKADAAAIGGTWKAIISGTTDGESAITRVGYDWSELQGMDGTTIVYAPNLWETSTSPLLNPIVKSEINTDMISKKMMSNTKSNGRFYTGNDINYNCNNWTSSTGSGSDKRSSLSSNTSSNWIVPIVGSAGCSTGRYLYCIEQ